MRGHLAAFKAPKLVHFVTTIGRSPAGKVDYARLRAETTDEVENFAVVERTMIDLMRLPTIKAGAGIPDVVDGTPIDPDVRDQLDRYYAHLAQH